MLANFTSAYTFNKLRITLVVDCVRKQADVTVVYDRRIRHLGKIAYWLVDTPEKAEAYWREDSVTHPEHGNRIEGLEAQYRLGFGIAAAPDGRHAA